MKKNHHYVLLTLTLASLPSLLRLPLWVAIVAGIGAAMHYSGSWRKKLPGKIVAALLLSAVGAGIWFHFESWFSGDAVLSFFIAVVFLKWAESESRRDYLLLIFSAVILATVGALAWDNLLNLIHMLVVIFSLTISLVAIHMDNAVSSRTLLFKKCSLIFVLAIPLMLLLFLTFPRIPGPLWDLGLAFGLPVKAMMDRGNGEFGTMKTLQPGTIYKASKKNGNVLVAEFEGAVPFKSMLYWRGPVFWDFDGETWNLPEDWDNRTKLLRKAIRSKKRFDREIHHRTTPVRYTLRVMPNGGRWLYGLEVPAAPAPETFISDEYQLLSIRKIDDFEPKLKMLSYLEYQGGVELTKEQRENGLAWPENQNPRLRELGKKLQQQFNTPDAILLEGYKLLATGNYEFDAAHIIEPGDHILDRYFFDEKKGGAEYLAGSFAMLMRAAGIPARLISGFRGGTIIALTNFVIVKQANAHAWLEVWLEGKGWNRVEPKDIVLPPDKKAAPPPQDQKEHSSQVEVKTVKNQAVQIAGNTSQNQKPNKDVTSGKQDKSRWEFPSISSLFGNMQKWVINYNPDRQMEILKGAGFENSNWLDLLLGCALGLATLLGIYLGGAWLYARKKIDKVIRAWLKFCQRMESLGLEKISHECPKTFLARIDRDKPEIKLAAEDIINRYIAIRYGNEQSGGQKDLLTRQVQRFISMT